MKKSVMFILAAALAILVGCAGGISTPRIDGSRKIDEAVPVLTWKPVRRVMHYEVQISIDPDFKKQPGTYLFKTREARLEVGADLQYDRYYFWRVRAVSWEKDKSEWSRKAHFRLGLRSPDPLSPQGNINERNPAFCWRKVPGAVKYEVEISTESRFRLKELKYNTEARDYFPRPFCL